MAQKKVFVLGPGEDWIVDRFVSEWNEDNSDISIKYPQDSEVIWLLADWCWRQLPVSVLRTKKVLTTVHHIVPEKFRENEKIDFIERDKITSAYHVFNKSTLDFIRPLTSKPIYLIPYWANQKIWKKTGEKIDLRRKYGLPTDSYLIGSFQRDTEGSDLKSPKLEKGPDLLCDYIALQHEKRKNVHVVLAGWRRQYVIERLRESGIPFSYFEKPSQAVVNDLYQTIDLYPVSARCEGGPQSLIECGLLQVPVVSRPIGIATQVLPEKSISCNLNDAIPEIPKVSDMILPKGYNCYRDVIQSL